MIRILYQRTVEKYRFQPHFTRFFAQRNPEGQKNRCLSRFGACRGGVFAAFARRARVG